MNQPLVAYNNAAALPHDPLALGRLFDLMFDMAKMSQVMLDARTTTKSIKSMTRLERSALSKTVSTARMDSTVHVVVFLLEVQQTLQAWLAAQLPVSVPGLVGCLQNMKIR